MDVRQRSMRLGALFIGLSLLACLSLLLTPFLHAHAATISEHPSQSNKGTVQILPRPLTTNAARQSSAAVPSVTAPAYTTSLYENTTDSTTMYNQGCSAAHGAAGLVVMDWGQPVSLSSGYGTYDFGGADVSDASILHAVANYVLGVWSCRTSTTDLAVAIGESNYGSSTSNWYADGQAWGSMVNSVQSYISNNGYSNVVGAYGAGDLETEWNSYSVTSSMVNGYNNTSSRLYFDFGDDTPGYWSDSQVWYVAWGAADSEPLPEIYYTADATSDWESLDVWACNNEGGTMDFKGTMSENASGTDSPSQSFDDMYNALGANSCTAGGRGSMIFETRISYA